MKLLLENWRQYVLFENIETASRLSIFDFDETIAFTEGHVNVINKITGEEFKTTSCAEYLDSLQTSSSMLLSISESYSSKESLNTSEKKLDLTP